MGCNTGGIPGIWRVTWLGRAKTGQAGVLADTTHLLLIHEQPLVPGKQQSSWQEYTKRYQHQDGMRQEH
jgi:hypothetical protein